MVIPLISLTPVSKKFLDKIFCKKLNRCTVPKKEFFIVLPYLGPLSSKIQKQIRNVFQKTMPWSKIKLTFKVVGY